MSDAVNLHFKYTEEEWVAASRLYVLRQPMILVRFGVAFLLLALAIFFLAAINDGIMPFILLSVGAILIAFLLLLFFILPRQRFRNDPRFRDEFFLEFAEDEIRFKTPHIESKYDWSLYTGVLENERFYVLIYGKGMISAIPKRAFTGSAQETAFRDLLRRKLLHTSDSRWLKERTSNEMQDAYVPPAEPPDWR
ncbi:MAG: YcxB family protein [Acidobacteria bacterium]|nr:YcxB family protein [Acidobacteriota bacterium]